MQSFFACSKDKVLIYFRFVELLTHQSVAKSASVSFISVSSRIITLLTARLASTVVKLLTVKQSCIKIFWALLKIIRFCSSLVQRWMFIILFWFIWKFSAPTFVSPYYFVLFFSSGGEVLFLVSHSFVWLMIDWLTDAEWVSSLSHISMYRLQEFFVCSVISHNSNF